ncbi:MAG: hypothetical protein NVS3B17_20130 [Vulcanimicrobiaceae bacterium]
MTVEIVDLGDWAAATLVAEYDPHGDVVRVNARAVASVRRALGDDAAERFVAVAIAHESHHRTHPGATEREAHAAAYRTTGVDPMRYEAVLRARAARP